MTTMADVAHRAGVSVSTVSHVINGTRVVSAETRNSVLAAIEETAYTRNTLARSLVTARTQTVGLAISAISNFYFADIIAAIEQAMSRQGYILLLAESHDDPKQEYEVVQALQQRRVDGVFLAPAASGDSPTLRYLSQLAVPTVLVDRLVSAPFDQIGTESKNAAARLVKHLVGHGHTRIAMISGIANVQTTEDRIAGYRHAVEASGLSFDPELIQSGESHADPAEQAVDRLLDLRDPPTALFVGNNHMAIGALRALRRRRKKIPDDLAFVSFDDFEWAELMSPRLTTMAQPIEKIGTDAAELMLSRIADPKQSPRRIELQPTFERRESCGCSAE